MIVLAIFTGFLLYMNWNHGEEPTFAISDDFEQVDSEQMLMAELTRQLTGSELAANYQLFEDVDYEKLLIEVQRTLKVEKAWLHQGELQLIYSIDLRREDQKQLDVPYLMFEEVGLMADGKRYNFELTTLETNWLSKGYVHNYRLYRGINIRMTGSEENFEKLQNITGHEEIDQIVIGQPNMIHGSFEDKKAMESMKIGLSLPTNANDELERMELNQRTNLNDGRTIEWEALTLFIHNTKLLFNMDTERPLQGMTLRVKKPNGEVFEDQVSVGSLGKGQYEVNMRGFTEFPNELDIEVTALEFMDEGTPMTFTIPKEIITQGLRMDKGESQSIEKKIGSKNGVNIFFEGLSTNDTYGGPHEELMGILVGLEGVEDKQFNTWFNYVTEGMQNLKYNISGDSESEVYQYRQGPLIEISDQDGNILEPIGSSLNPTPEKEVQNILIERTYFENASEINLKISHFPYVEQLEENNTTFKLTSKGG